LANLTSVDIASGVPITGTGTISTIDQMLNQGVPISDGTITNKTAVKGSSTAASTADKSLVANESPNSQLSHLVRDKIDDCHHALAGCAHRIG